MAKLENRTRQILVFNIPCPPGCGGADKLCTRIEQSFTEEAADGTRGIRIREKHLPGSITILAGKKLNVPAFVLAAPDVKRAIDRGTLRLL